MQYILNVNQSEAVNWNGGPLLVLAGPGSGKTLVLTLRIAKLLTSSPGKRFRVLGLTFTNKAAAEMRERLEQLVPSCADRSLLTTFHSFAADILRQHGSHAGISPDFTILSDEADREEVLRSAIQKHPDNHNSLDEADLRLLPLITNLLEKLVPESEVKSRIRDAELGNKISFLYKAYRDELRIHNQLDYPSLLAFAHDVLTTAPDIAEQFRIIYPYVCVDEFQDTNLAQYLFLRAVVGPSAKNLFIVADDDQIVYQWNGASPERLRELRQDYNMSVIQLPANYRCPPQVIQLANNLIRHNLDRSPDKQPLVAARAFGSQDVIRIQKFADLEQELEWIVGDIRFHTGDWHRNTAVLARTKALAESACTKLNEAGIFAITNIRKSQFASAPFRWLHAVLRLANTRGDREQLRRICKAFYDLEGVAIRPQDVVAAASALGGDLLRGWIGETLAKRNIAADSRALLVRMEKELADRLEYQSFTDSAIKWFERLFSDTNQLSAQHFVDYVEERQAWHDLVAGIYQRFGRDETTLNVLLHELDLSSKQPPVPPDAVKCFTIHTAKGMEFDHVYLIGLAEDILPSFQSIRKGSQSHEMQEERRSCFVAVTRARSDITFTYAEEYFGYSKEPSRFLVEMGLIRPVVGAHR